MWTGWQRSKGITDPDTLADEFKWSKGINDHELGDDRYSRLVYLYELKTVSKRRKELLKIINSLCPIFAHINRDYCKAFDGLTLYDLDYPAERKFQFDL